MNRPRIILFVLCALSGALSLFLALIRIRSQNANEAEDVKPSAIAFMPSANDNGRESGSPMKKDRNDVTTASSYTSAVYPDSIWEQGFRASNPNAFNEILVGFESRGALASLSLTVLDETGSPVPDASVRLRPYASVRGWKEHRWFQKPFPVFALLREKQAPHEMAFRSIRVSLPPPGETMGFDLVEGKPTPPYGSGSIRDFEITETRSPHKRNPHSTEDWFSTLQLVYPNGGDGSVVFQRDDCSELKVPRFAPDEGYRSNLESTIRFVGGKFAEDGMIRPNEYLEFRIRSKTLSKDPNNSAVFGKMCGDWHVNGFRRYVSFRIWTNEKVGDRNLEDTSGWW